MAENAYFLDGNITKADDNATKKRIMQQDGYLDGVGSELAVIQHTPPDMIVIAGTGEMWIQGVRFVNTAAKDVAIDAADATNPRIDRIVVRLTWASNDLEIVCLKGTAAASPSAPTLTQTAAVWENSLAQVYIPAGVTEIYTLVATNGSYITSERLTQYCGVAGCRSGKQHNNTDGTWDFANERGTNLADPVDAHDAANKEYVDGLSYFPSPTGHTGQALGTPDGSTYDFITLQKFDHIQEATGSHGIVVDSIVKSNGNSTAGTVHAHSSTVTDSTSVLIIRAGVYSVRWKSVYDTSGKTLTIYKNGTTPAWTTINGGAGSNTWSASSDLTLAADDLLLLQTDLSAGAAGIVEFRNADGNWMAV